jgi:AcrR family transcriptional regulator
MADDVKATGRSYDATRRVARARHTRRTIIEAAIRLFTAQGYGATTLQAIADEAGVAVQTIYATLENKPTILAEALDVAIAGDDEPVVINEREWMNEVWTAATAEQRLLAYAEAVGQIMERASDMFMVVTGAALTDSRLAAIDNETQRRRRDGASRVVDSVAEVSRLAAGLSPERATDIVWLLNSPVVHQQLVRAAGWSRADYVGWLGRTLVRELLGDDGSPPATTP